MPDAGAEAPLHREVQPMRRSPLVLVVAAVALFQWWLFVQQVLLGRPVGDNPGPDLTVVLLWFLVGVAIPAAFVAARLETDVVPGTIRYRWFPLHLRARELPLSEVAEVEAVTYRPLLEYGGWGIRYGRRGKAYTVRGNRGVRLQLHEGREVLLGSEDPETLAAAIATARREP